MQLCAHVIKNDTGLAPNPFHGYCTSALCTPSHMRARLSQGDWLIGNSPKGDGRRLVYAMRILEVLKMDQYFQDERFTTKKPNPDGAPNQQCGDNFYWQSETGEWKRLCSAFHNDPASFTKDVGKDRRGRPVFVARHFYYFGSERVVIPHELTSIAQHRQGLRYERGELATRFVTWIESHYRPGVLGTPRDMADRRPAARTSLHELTEGIAAPELRVPVCSRTIVSSPAAKPVCR